MNDRQNPQGEQFYGYDAHGQPVYHDPYGAEPGPPGYGDTGGRPDPYGQSGPYAAHDPYAGQTGTSYDTSGYDGGGPYASDPYAPGQLGQGSYAATPYGPPGAAGPAPGPGPGTYDTGQFGPYGGPAYDTGELAASAYETGELAASAYDTGQTGAQPYGLAPGVGTAAYDTGEYSPVPQTHTPVPQAYQPGGAAEGSPVVPGPRAPESGPAPAPEPPSAPARKDGPEGAYQTEEFAFVEESEEDSEDVIDWLKFSESRTERREEARRRAKNRVIALVVVLALSLAGGIGYLWQAGKLPGFEQSADKAASAADTRHVIVVHLRELESGDITTALLVNNETAGRGTTVLLPNSLALKGESGSSTTLGKSFSAQGAGATRDSLNALLGSNIEGTWRLDTPYLENLVEAVNGITLDADATVPGPKKGDKPLVTKGSGQELNGQAAVAYATYRDAAEPQTKQLARFGQVMHALLKKVSTDKEQAATSIEALGQILDFSLTEAELGAALASLAKHVKNGDYETELLPVEANGTISEETSQGVVKEALGGSVRNTEPGEAARLTVRNATGTRGAADGAGVTLVNGGFTVVSTGAAASAEARSTVTYRTDAHAKDAKEAAKTLGLSEDAVEKGEGAANADITVVLGRDYSG